MKKAFFTCLSILLTACTPLSESVGGADVDLAPPVLLAARVPGPYTVELEFDESPRVDLTTCLTEPDLRTQELSVDEKKVLISFAREQRIGDEYHLRLTVEDAAGNSSWLIIRFYGFNPSPPRLVINEFTTQGSKAHPDLVEVKVTEGGNLGGVTFYRGTDSLHDFRFVLPPLAVAAGDFILIHTKPSGIPEEIDETESRDASGGLDASPLAYDFWVKEGTGLSGNNGVISVYTAPGGTLVDAVLYSTRTSDSDTTWRGFGSYDLREQADELAVAGVWYKAGEMIAPEDAVNPQDSTATRSLCRSRTSADTDTKEDFHIVPTKKSSFGKDNCDEKYVR